MKYITTVNGQTFEIEINKGGQVIVNGKERIVDFQTISESLISALIDNASFEALVEEQEGRYDVLMSGDLYEIDVADERQQRLMKASKGFEMAQGEISLRSPMPGLIVAVPVVEGQAVEKGDPV